MTATVNTSVPSPGAQLPRRPQAPNRVGPVRAGRHGLTLAWRSLLKIKHSPEQLLDLTLQPIVFVVLFVYLFGGAIAGNQHTYLQFVLPGILVQTVAFASLGTGVGLSTDLETGVFDRFRSLPIARSAPLVGHILGDLVRYVVSIVVVLGFGTALGFRVQTTPFSALLAAGLVLLFAFGLCWMTALIGLVFQKPRTVQGVGGLLFFPLTFGSDLFVKTGTLPGWLQAWVKINPVTQVVDATRSLLLGGPATEYVLRSLLAVAVFCAVFIPLALLVYRRRTS